jgi:hypothetical protein
MMSFEKNFTNKIPGSSINERKKDLANVSMTLIRIILKTMTMILQYAGSKYFFILKLERIIHSKLHHSAQIPYRIAPIPSNHRI